MWRRFVAHLVGADAFFSWIRKRYAVDRGAGRRAAFPHRCSRTLRTKQKECLGEVVPGCQADYQHQRGSASRKARCHHSTGARKSRRARRLRSVQHPKRNGCRSTRRTQPIHVLDVEITLTTPKTFLRYRTRLGELQVRMRGVSEGWPSRQPWTIRIAGLDEVDPVLLHLIRQSRVGLCETNRGASERHVSCPLRFGSSIERVGARIERSSA